MADNPELTKKGTPRKRAPGGGKKTTNPDAEWHTIRIDPEPWAWLLKQAGGASATLRRLVGAAMKGDNNDQSTTISD